MTGANLEESLFRLVAHKHYKDFPDYRYFTKKDDTKILAERMRRVTDTSIPEDEAFRAVEKYIVPMWKNASESGKRRFWHEYFYELIQTGRCETRTRETQTSAGCPRAAKRENCLIVVPGYEDSTFGNIFTSHRGTRAISRRRIAKIAASSTWPSSTISTKSSLSARVSASSSSAAASPAIFRFASCRRSNTTSSSR